MRSKSGAAFRALFDWRWPTRWKRRPDGAEVGEGRDLPLRLLHLVLAEDGLTGREGLAHALRGVASC